MKFSEAGSHSLAWLQREGRDSRGLGEEEQRRLKTRAQVGAALLLDRGVYILRENQQEERDGKRSEKRDHK